MCNAPTLEHSGLTDLQKYFVSFLLFLFTISIWYRWGVLFLFFIKLGVHMKWSPLPISQGTSHFKGCLWNLHGLQFHSARRCSPLHARLFDFTDAGTNEAICYPFSFTRVCQLTEQYLDNHIIFSLAFIPYFAKGGFSLGMLNTSSDLCLFFASISSF